MRFLKQFEETKMSDILLCFWYIGWVHVGVVQADEEYTFVIIPKPRMQEVKSLGEESEIACLVFIFLVGYGLDSPGRRSLMWKLEF